MNHDWEMPEAKKDKIDLVLEQLNKIENKLDTVQKNYDKLKHEVSFKLNDIEFLLNKKNKEEHHKEIISILEQNKTILNKECKTIEEYKTNIDLLKKNNDKIVNNLSDVIVKLRNNNFVWRNYQSQFKQKFPGLLTNILF